MPQPEASCAPPKLLDGIRLRDAASFIQLYDLHARHLYGLMLQTGSDAQQAGEVLERLFAELWSGAIQLNDERTVLLELIRHANALRVSKRPLDSKPTGILAVQASPCQVA